MHNIYFQSSFSWKDASLPSIMNTSSKSGIHFFGVNLFFIASCSSKYHPYCLPFLLKCAKRSTFLSIRVVLNYNPRFVCTDCFILEPEPLTLPSDSFIRATKPKHLCKDMCSRAGQGSSSLYFFKSLQNDTSFVYSAHRVTASVKRF